MQNTMSDIKESAVNKTTIPAQEVVFSLYKSEDKVYARSVSGLYNRWRWVMVWATQLFFYGVPWLQWDGRQAMLFDLEAKRFYIFGLIFHPQDLIYLSFLLIVLPPSLKVCMETGLGPEYPNSTLKIHLGVWLFYKEMCP